MMLYTCNYIALSNCFGVVCEVDEADLYLPPFAHHFAHHFAHQYVHLGRGSFLMCFRASNILGIYFLQHIISLGNHKTTQLYNYHVYTTNV